MWGGTFWEPLRNLAWERVPGNLAWEPVLGNLGHFLGKGNPFLGTWFPTLRGADLAAPRPAPGPLIWLQAYALGEKTLAINRLGLASSHVNTI